MRNTASTSVTLRSRMASLAVLLPLLALTEVLRAIDLAGAPQRTLAEGTLMAQAHAFLHFGALNPYAYQYQIPALGPVQLAGWLGFTDGIWGAPDAVLAGRRFMIIVALVSAALIWVLVRRLGCTRFTAAAAVAVFAVSPMAIGYGRTVGVENIAMMWVLAAAVCLCSPQRRVAAYLGGAACLAVAVLTSGVTVLVLPGLFWLGWQRGDVATRKYALAAAGALFTGILAVPVVVAALRAELFPGAGHPSLLQGIVGTFSGPGGTVFKAGSANQQTVLVWLGFDGVLLVAGLVAALAAIAVVALRPLAVGQLAVAATLLQSGNLTETEAVVLVPLSALLIACVAESAIRALPAAPVATRVGAIVLLVAAGAAAAVAVPFWGPTLSLLSRADVDAPMREARDWLTANASRADRVLVDPAQWSDLLAAGWHRDDVTWFSALDTDPGVLALNQHGFRDYDYVVSTPSARRSTGSAPQLRAALSASTAVATFGSGADRVEVRRIDHASTATAPALAAEPERATVGAALAARLGDGAPASVADLLRTGRVDARVLATVSDLAATEDVRVADLPAVGGDDAAKPRRQVLISGPGAEHALAYFQAQRGAFAAASVTAGPSGVLVTFPQATVAGLLSAAVTPPPAGPAADVRVLDLVPGSAGMRVRFTGVDGTGIAPVTVGGYGTASPYSALPSGVVTLGVGAGDGSTPFTLLQTAALAPGGTYTLMVFATADGKGVRGDLVPDPAAPGPSGARPCASSTLRRRPA